MSNVQRSYNKNELFRRYKMTMVQQCNKKYGMFRIYTTQVENGNISCRDCAR